MPYSDELRKKSNNADEIIPGIFLGNEESSQDSDFIKKKGITAVINCTPSVPNKHKTKGVAYIRLPLDDSLKNKDINLMSEWLPYVVDQLKILHKKKKKKILIHCHAGMQRSAIVVAAYLVDTKDMAPLEAIKFIIQKRPIAFHNGESLNFEDSLKKFHLNKKRFTPRVEPKIKSKSPPKSKPISSKSIKPISSKPIKPISSKPILSSKSSSSSKLSSNPISSNTRIIRI